MKDTVPRSIGEVLDLLKDEFPDITISKIRFLEGQGLLDIERTPSGYRKFHSDDVERLRWILRQQREHFLPLRVIRERLGGATSEAAGEHDGDADGPGPIDLTDGAATVEERVAVGVHAEAAAGGAERPALA
nr:MerR family transcriptional regulator [Acidimicrobiia bacterium]